MVISKADNNERDNIPLDLWRYASATSSVRSNLQSGASLEPKGQVSSGESLADAPAVTNSASCYPNHQQFTALGAGEVKRHAEYIPKPCIFRGRTRAIKRRLNTASQTDLVSVVDELGIALHVEEENILEQALQVDIETSIEMPTGKIQDLPPPSTTQKEVRQSVFRKASLTLSEC